MCFKRVDDRIWHSGLGLLVHGGHTSLTSPLPPLHPCPSRFTQAQLGKAVMLVLGSVNAARVLQVRRCQTVHGRARAACSRLPRLQLLMDAGLLRGAAPCPIKSASSLVAPQARPLVRPSIHSPRTAPAARPSACLPASPPQERLPACVVQPTGTLRLRRTLPPNHLPPSPRVCRSGCWPAWCACPCPSSTPSPPAACSTASPRTRKRWTQPLGPA